jgi:hypothetical protein
MFCCLCCLQIQPSTVDTRRACPWISDGMPATVTVFYQHNHVVVNAEALSFKRVDDVTCQKFQNYFDQGMTPTAAIDYHNCQLELESDGDNAVVVHADASINPKYATVGYWHSMWRNSNLGHRTGDRMWDVLSEKLEVYKDAGIKISVQREPVCVAILTPVMQRAHTLITAKDVTFVDSTASCDSNNHVITFMLVKSPCGAVPVGITLTAGQSERDYVVAFNALKSLMGEGSFGGRNYPDVFITDDSTAEKNALKSVWRETTQKLCHFHVLQAVWRWLWGSKHGIPKEDRQPLMVGFRKVLYATQESDAAQLCAELLNDAVDYPGFQGYVEELWERREEWCMAYRYIPGLRGNHTNNYAEVTVRLFKDNILTRCKAFNLVALIDFIVFVMDKYYRNRLQRFANGRITAYFILFEKLLSSCKYITSGDQIQVCSVTGTNTYCVPSESIAGVNYDVDAVLGVCSCMIGMSGKFCKHQAAVYKWHNESLPNLPPVSSQSRYEAAFLALGDAVPHLDFYESFSVVENDAISVQSFGRVDDMVSSSNVSVAEIDRFENISQSVCVENSEAQEKWRAISEYVGQLINIHRCSSELLSGLDRFHERVNSVSNSSQLASLFHNSGQSVPRRYRPGAMIRVQPTALSRRKPGITRGSKRIHSGRPAKGEEAAKKRPRNLARNIAACVPNAKSHGIGH